MNNSFALILACYASGQMDEKQWAAHMQDDLFAAWVRKRDELR